MHSPSATVDYDRLYSWRMIPYPHTSTWFERSNKLLHLSTPECFAGLGVASMHPNFSFQQVSRTIKSLAPGHGKWCKHLIMRTSLRCKEKQIILEKVQ
jgi:hypothetical protein